MKSHPKSSSLSLAPQSKPRWRILLLFPLALFLPFITELVQRLVIGEEQVCCMLENYDFLMVRAGIARRLRWLSNLLIGGSMIGGSALAIFALVKVCREMLPTIVQKYRVIVLVLCAILTVYIVATLFTMLLFFVFRNDLYYSYRPWPGGSLYDDNWFSPLHWWRAAFYSPF